jgi:hypothetical protein
LGRNRYMAENVKQTQPRQWCLCLTRDCPYYKQYRSISQQHAAEDRTQSLVTMNTEVSYFVHMSHRQTFRGLPCTSYISDRQDYWTESVSLYCGV